ncbi:HlyD family efflux transporter periplasmic adaptor subunit [Proteus vulgaris]|uniref:HlyD family efflux transporter periplasmic adaptor subunit n=1 Tax=Proteus vulgaris TaxID=585 RepID=UPI003F68E85C
MININSMKMSYSFCQNLNHLQKRQQLKTIRSPITGTIQQVSVYTLRQCITTYQSVMTVVPDNQVNIAEVNLLIEILVLFT